MLCLKYTFTFIIISSSFILPQSASSIAKYLYVDGKVMQQEFTISLWRYVFYHYDVTHTSRSGTLLSCELQLHPCYPSLHHKPPTPQQTHSHTPTPGFKWPMEPGPHQWWTVITGPTSIHPYHPPPPHHHLLCCSEASMRP